MLLHSATFSVHDNTYKRVAGDWKEWESVIWDRELNQRKFHVIVLTVTSHCIIVLVGITYARLYCKRETKEAFKAMFGALFGSIERVTGKPVQFKFMHGMGLAAIILNGCKAQAEGLGEYLLSRSITIPIVPPLTVDSILPKILRVCIVHLDR